MARKAVKSVAKAVGEYQYPWKEKLAKYFKDLSKGVWGYWELGAWQPLAISGRHRARLRKEVILAGEGWTYDPARKEMKTKRKGYKCDKISADKRAKTAELMKKMPQMLADYRKRRWQKKMNEEDAKSNINGQLKDRDATKSEGSSFFQRERERAKIDKCGFTPKKAFHRALHRSVLLKGLFKPKPLLPDDLVRRLRSLLLNSNPDFAGTKRPDKSAEINELLFKMKSVLYGSDEVEPVAEACARLTQEFFRDNTLRLLIIYLPQLELEARNDATQVIANLQRQQVNSRLVASDYLEANLDLMDHLMSGYDNPDIALHYGSMLRVCARHQSATKYVLQTKYIIKLFDYMQCPSFGIATDATATFKELLTRHKSAVAEFLSQNYNWFFDEFNSKLLESSNYITRRQAVKLLGDILLDRSNSPIMVRYVSSIENLRISMNLLRESSKSIQIDAFHVFKLFVANEKKPAEIVGILVANRSKLLRLFDAFKIDKEDEQFEADKAQVVSEISGLKL